MATDLAQSSDLELLALETATLWPRARGAGQVHDEPRPPLVVAATNQGLVALPGPEVPAAIAAALVQTVADADPPEPGRPPAVLESCRSHLAKPFGALEVAGGPSYAIQPPVADPPPAAGGFAGTVISSAGGPPDRTPGCPRSWEPAEWSQLLTGGLGPWAIVLATDRSVLAICHTPVWSERAAEAGVWTRPDVRGQGHAARATAAWARLPAHHDRVLFYSTWAANHSSQRVAARLGLRPIGWLWKLRPPAVNDQAATSDHDR